MTAQMTVYKSNYLVEAGYKLSLAEQRMILLSLAQIDSRNSLNKQVTIFAKDISKEWGVDEKTAIRDLKTASKRLFDRYITLKNDKETTKFRWIQDYVEYHNGEGRVSFTYSDRIAPLLFELKLKEGNYTKYELLNVSGFSRTYSFRFYELLVKIKGMSNQSITIDELRRILQLEDKYKEFKEFNKFVLKLVIKEINDKSDLSVEYTTIKRGRSVYALKFNIKNKVVKNSKKRPKFPHKNKYGKFVKLDKQNPKMSNHEYGLYAKDCLTVLESFYKNIEDVTTEDLRNYWVFLAGNDSNKSKLGTKQDFLVELRKRGYKIVDCELLEIPKNQIDFIGG